MAVLVTHPIIKELVKALGLPKHTISFNLRVAVGELVTIECTYRPEAAMEGIEESDFHIFGIPELFKRFDLVAAEHGKEINADADAK